MRMTQLFGHRLREAPGDADVIGHQLLLRAGFIRQLGAGIYAYLPLAHRAMQKIAAIMREEINAIGGQEMTMPVINPAELWKATGRWEAIGAEMGRFKDRVGRDMALAMTHEESVVELARRDIQSYKQLPLLLYHIQTKWRDDPRPRAGLIRVREFTMLDSYSLDADEAGLERQYQAHYRAYFRIFARCGLPVIAVASDVGMMGGSQAHEYMYLTAIGEDTLLLCDACGHSANRQVAAFRKPAPLAEDLLPLEKVATPEMKTIQALAEFLDVPASRTAKAVFMVAQTAEGAKFIFAVIRGDMDVNETKLANAVGALELRPATDDEIRTVGASPGYASPLGIENTLLVVDDLIPGSPNLVAGANEEGYHLRNVNYGRDYTAALVADIAAAREGDACPACGAPLRESRGVEVGNIFKLGTRYSAAVGATFLRQDGEQAPIIMGSYGIGVGRLLACIAEEYNDEFGLRWPVSIAPYAVHLVALPSKGQSEHIIETAKALYTRLQAAGIEVLYDDRAESAGVKFNDADLIGLPLRVTVSGRSLEQSGVELKRRDQAERSIIPLAEAETQITAILKMLNAELHP